MEARSGSFCLNPHRNPPDLRDTPGYRPFQCGHFLEFSKTLPRLRVWVDAGFCDYRFAGSRRGLWQTQDFQSLRIPDNHRPAIHKLSHPCRPERRLKIEHRKNPCRNPLRATCHGRPQTFIVFQISRKVRLFRRNWPIRVLESTPFEIRGNRSSCLSHERGVGHGRSALSPSG